MNRRHFLRQSALISAGALLLPPALLEACRKKSADEDIGFGGKVLIIGAGAAGLYAGYILRSKGIDFEILEASSAYGGRVGKINGFADFPLDTGAQWLHGKNNILGDLIAKTQTEITLDDSAEFFWFNNQITGTLPDDIEAIFLREDNVPDVSFKDFAVQEGFGNEYADIVEGIAGDSGAAASRISAYWKIQEEAAWNSGDDDFKFRGTYFDFIDTNIAAQVKDRIQLNTIVSKIDYSQSSVVVTDSNNNTYTADKVIVTVPVTILKAGDIEFVPALTQEKTDAFAKIGMDAGMKVFLKFSSAFYHQNIIGGNTCGAYADEIIGKTGSDHVLLAFIMGEQAERLTALGSDSAITSALLQELDTMYSGQATASFIGSQVINWTTHPFIRGAYSYSTVGMGNARETAAQPVDKKIFFAGEAMNYNGNHQTVFGAVETGYREVINILNSVKK
ncbi:MAG TPA: NAD(P)/FAD-dependent oxidoreductase [Bacteroidia bacterium]|nr:NAD(P)/FAD-dependent oxidoreductase [Bacteroidia bacterium]